MSEHAFIHFVIRRGALSGGGRGAISPSPYAVFAFLDKMFKKFLSEKIIKMSKTRTTAAVSCSFLASPGPGGYK